MKIPLILLTICATAAGLVPFASFVTVNGVAMETKMDPLFSLAPVGLSTLAILLAARLYKVENDQPERIAAAFGGFYKTAFKKFYIDECYLFITKKIIFPLIGQPAAWMDKHIVDGSINGLAAITAKAARLIKGVQSGKVQEYALYFFGGIISLAVLIIYLWK